MSFWEFIDKQDDQMKAGMLIAVCVVAFITAMAVLGLSANFAETRAKEAEVEIMRLKAANKPQ